MTSSQLNDTLLQKASNSELHCTIFISIARKLVFAIVGEYVILMQYNSRALHMNLSVKSIMDYLNV
jgi:hypothetical protein